MHFSIASRGDSTGSRSAKSDRRNVVDPDAPPVPDAPVEQAKAEHATGRNAPCPCGSGKKYKKCCGLTP